MVAQVIINQTSKQTDKKYDYLIPESLENKIKIGIRVIVPFGNSNKQVEGYVTGIFEHSKTKKLKSILDAEEKPMFDEKMMSLIEWMREKYLCTYMDIIRVIVPSGTSVKNVEWAVIDKTDEKLTKKEKALVDAIINHGGSCEAENLLQLFEGENMRPALKNLYQKGILKKEYKEFKNISDKTVRIVKLAIDPEDVKACVEAMTKRRAYVQAKVIEILTYVDIISSVDLQHFAECTSNTLTLLEKRGLIEFENVVVERRHKRAGEIKPTYAPSLSMEQENASNKIREALGEFREFLLHGVTGSGKTEVFMNVIKTVVDSGKKAIMLVPEIALTPQMMERFIARFGERVSVFHSGLSMGERYDEWKKMRDGKTDIVIGARSAVFAPFDDVGIVIMDEEHELSYKSEMLPRYDTKEVAVFRAKQNNCPIIYASATPDIKTYYRSQKKQIELLELNTRINKRPIPRVSVIDMRKELQEGNRSIFSNLLLNEIKYNLENKEQTILFLNRRGFSTFVSCRNCGFVASCPNCNISLTYHKFSDSLKCHYCGHTISNYKECPQCKSSYIRYFGGGTQKVEEEIKKIFPNATTLRMDVDTTSKQNSHEKLLTEFSENNIDILIGTQMVAKGLDFPNVTLVGVVSADTVLNIDDYRSAERAFDLLEQVSGRAGRDKKRGRAIIQTYSPEHNAVIFAKNHNYKDFYSQEIAIRKVLWYPPFCDMVSVLFSGEYENTVSQCARRFSKVLSEEKINAKKIRILGPVPASITKIKNKYRWRILIKCDDADKISNALVTARDKCLENKNYEKVSIVIDKNPNNIY